jgi:hypothetical protein
VGDFRAAPHRDPNLSARECRNIIDAVSDHRNSTAKADQLIHTGQLLLRQQTA